MAVDFNQAEVSVLIEAIEGFFMDGWADDELVSAFEKLKEAEEGLQ